MFTFTVILDTHGPYRVFFTPNSGPISFILYDPWNAHAWAGVHHCPLALPTMTAEEFLSKFAADIFFLKGLNQLTPLATMTLPRENALPFEVTLQTRYEGFTRSLA